MKFLRKLLGIKEVFDEPVVRHLSYREAFPCEDIVTLLMNPYVKPLWSQKLCHNYTQFETEPTFSRVGDAVTVTFGAYSLQYTYQNDSQDVVLTLNDGKMTHAVRLWSDAYPGKPVFDDEVDKIDRMFADRHRLASEMAFNYCKASIAVSLIVAGIVSFWQTSLDRVPREVREKRYQAFTEYLASRTTGVDYRQSLFSIFGFGGHLSVIQGPPKIGNVDTIVIHYVCSGLLGFSAEDPSDGTVDSTKNDPSVKYLDAGSTI